MRVTISALAGGQALDCIVDVDPRSELNQTDRPACIHCLSRKKSPQDQGHEILDWHQHSPSRLADLWQRDRQGKDQSWSQRDDLIKRRRGI